MRKAIVFLLLLLLVLLAVFVCVKYPGGKKDVEVACTLEAKICPDGTSIGRIPPKCEFAVCPEIKDIVVSSPTIGNAITSPVKIEGYAIGPWFFEAQFSVELWDSSNKKLGTAILTAQDDWMTESSVKFEGYLTFARPSVTEGTLKFLSANPSGLPENQREFELPVKLSLTEKTSVLLYYYNPEKDKDSEGNLECSSKGLVAITRELPETKTPIKDTIELFLKGKENLTPEDVSNGIQTEYPLDDLKLKELKLDEDGILTIILDDPLTKTSGGSCRIGILSMQLTETAKQFPEVKSVRYSPEFLFQP